LSGAGCTFSGNTLPLSGTGRIRAGNFSIAGNVSSQFISGLLFVLPLLNVDSRVILTTPLESAAYVDMTIEVLRLFGIKIEKGKNEFRVTGNQAYISGGNVRAEGDWSNAAFFLCAGAMAGNVTVSGLSPHSAQGDREVINILARFGAETGECSARSKPLRAIEIDAAQIPDLVPALAVTASAAKGVTRIYNAGRLRIKESDRIQSTFNLLSALGADAEMTSDGLVIRGKEKLRGGVVDGAGDHRIVMAAAQASCVCETPVLVKGGEAVNKSYPSFVEDFRSLGGVADVV
jgi:3-phosphoshikimate 1-carboxyvinyltransferase